MPNPKPTPPKGYNLVPADSSVPAFIQQGVDMSKVNVSPAPPPETPLQKRAISYANTGDPYRINVGKPKEFTGPIFNHELTHTFQATRNPSLGETSAPMSDDPRLAPYGGIEGLKKASSIAQFNAEQQANIVMDYKAIQDKYLAKAKAGTASPAELRVLYEAHQAYHPLVKQLAAMPGTNAKLQPSALDLMLNRNIPSLDLKPEAPGLPSYDTPGLGVVPADPLLGGQSQPTRKIGDTKRFANGKTGRWDGHGWVQQ